MVQPDDAGAAHVPSARKKLVVEETVPGTRPFKVVVGDEAKEKLGMNYAELVPVLINAIKEQQQQINDLKKDIELLKNKK